MESVSELPPPVAAKLRSAFLSILPPLVVGSDATTWMVDGIAKRLIASVAACRARPSLSLAGSATWAVPTVTNASRRYAQRASAMPITAAFPVSFHDRIRKRWTSTFWESCRWRRS